MSQPDSQSLPPLEDSTSPVQAPESSIGSRNLMDIPRKDDIITLSSDDEDIFVMGGSCRR
jgi:hypothetical protein